MNTELLESLQEQAMQVVGYTDGGYTEIKALDPQKFAALLVNQAVQIINNYQIPVGNSPAGEIACDMTYRALVDLRQQIREHFGVQR